MASLQKIIINLPSESELGAQSEATSTFRNWYESLHLLDFTSNSLEQVSHALQNSGQLIFGLTGNDSPSCHLPGNTVPADDEDGLATSSRFDQRLVSQCSSIMLKRHCDKIIMSTALVKTRGEKQLFLATDFLQWHDSQSGKTQLAPLILYPVQLFYNDLEPNSTESFLLYADAYHAIENRSLLEIIRAQIDKPIAEFDPQKQQAFLLSVAVALQSTPDISLCRKISINVLKTGKHDSTPSDGSRYRRSGDRDLDLKLASALIKNRNLTETRILIETLQDTLDSVFNDADQSAFPDRGTRDKALTLTSMGLGNLSLHHIQDLPAKIQHWLDKIESGLTNPFFRELSDITSLSAKTLAGISDAFQLLQHAPDHSTHQYHADHAYQNTLASLQRAKFQYRLITVEIDSLSALFNLDPVPNLDEIRELCEILEKKEDLDTGIVDTQYFHARKKLAALFKNGSVNYGENEELLLRRLMKILRLRELFIHNNEYKLAFGHLFNGMDTHWRELESSIMFARQITDKIDNESLAAYLLDQWHHGNLDPVEASQFASDVSRSAKRLLRLLQVPVDAGLNIATLLDHTAEFKDKIQGLTNSLEISPSISALNAQSILDALDLLERSRQRYQACTSEEEAKAFRKRTLNTFNWLETILTRNELKIRDIEILLSRMSD